MTFLVVLKFFEKYNLDFHKIKIKVSVVASNITGTVAELRHKDELTVYDLFYGLMLPSGNDAAIVLAEGIGTFF